MRATVFVAAAAAVLGGGEVAAAGASAVKVGTPARVEIRNPGAETWRLYLHRGHDYAVAAELNGDADVRVADARGRTLADAMAMGSNDIVHGASFRAAYDGLYFVTVRLRSLEFGPADGSVLVERDCAAGSSTGCKLPVGTTWPAVPATYADDVDWFRTDLATGRTYRLSLDTTDPHFVGCAGRDVVDGGGAVVVAPPDTPAFTVPRSGTYYVRAANACDWGGTYRIRLE